MSYLWSLPVMPFHLLPSLSPPFSILTLLLKYYLTVLEMISVIPYYTEETTPFRETLKQVGPVRPKDVTGAL